MKPNAYLVMPVSGGYGVGAVGLSFPQTAQILDAMAGSDVAGAPPESMLESEIRILPFEALSPDQGIAVVMNPSTPFLAAEMPAQLPAPIPATCRVSRSGVSWYDPGGAFSTQHLKEHDILTAACVGSGVGDDVSALLTRLAALDLPAAFNLVGGTYRRSEFVDLPLIACGVVTPACLEPFLTCADRHVREQAIAMLGRFRS